METDSDRGTQTMWATTEVIGSMGWTIGDVGLAVAIGQRTIDRLQGDLVEADVHLRYCRHATLAIDAAQLGVMAEAHLDGVIEVPGRVLPTGRGNNAGGCQPLFEVHLSEGGQRVVEVFEDVVEKGRVVGTAAMFVVLVRPKLLVGAALFERFPARHQLRLDRLEQAGVERMVGATIRWPRGIIVLGPGAVYLPAIGVRHTGGGRAEGLRPLDRQQHEIEMMVL